MFCKAFYRQNEESYLEGQVSGFEYFGGAPHKVIFDNAKVAVKEGFGVHAKAQDSQSFTEIPLICPKIRLPTL